MEKNVFVRLRDRFPVLLAVLGMVLVIPLSSLAEDRLVVEDSSANQTFVVEDNGAVYTANRYKAQSASPGFWLDETGEGYKGAFFVLDQNWMQVQRRSQGFGAYEASPIFINIGAPGASFYLNSNGHIGFGVNPEYPLDMAGGAYCDGSDWISASSREYKQNINDLSTQEAMATLQGLNPVKFNYKKTPDEENLGFIAEDVPDLVATKDRKGMSSMDVVAVLTKVVQEQQKTIAELTKKLDSLERMVKLERTPTLASVNVDR